MAGAAAADDDDAAHATRGDDEAVEHVIGGGDRTEVVRLWRGRRLVATYVSPRAWQRLGGDRARDGAALLIALDAPLGTIVRTSRTSTFKRGGDRVAAVPAFCTIVRLPYILAPPTSLMATFGLAVVLVLVLAEAVAVVPASMSPSIVVQPAIIKAAAEIVATVVILFI